MSTLITATIIVLASYLLGIVFFLLAAVYLRSGEDTTDEDRRMAASVIRNAWAWPLAYVEYGIETLRNRRNHR